MTNLLTKQLIASEWPCADIHETATKFEIEVETPGLGPEDLTVEVEGHTLRVFGEPEHGHEGNPFDFVFSVPATADLKRLRARFVNHVLTISAPLRPFRGRRTLEIETQNLANPRASGV